MKKLIIKKRNEINVIKEAEGAYCDFCGEDKGHDMFESEYESKEHCSCSCMQICYDCVKQLYKFL